MLHTGSVTKGSTDEEGGVPARTKGSVPQQTSKRQWQGQRGEQGTHDPIKMAALMLHLLTYQAIMFTPFGSLR
eukprot:1151962-Pelagomonas_calceolata.AAC.4